MRYFLKTAWILVLVIVLTACSSIQAAEKHPPDSHKVKDSLGREVWVPNKINRIAALYATTGYILTLLGEGDKIVAVPGGLKRDKLMSTLVPTINKAVVPQEEGKINIEELAKVKPDIVFINEETSKDAAQMKQLDQLHIPYLAISFNSIKQQQQAIELIGDLVGEKAKAQKFLTYYNAKMELVEKRVQSVPKNKRIHVYHSINEATRTDSPDTLSADWLIKAGAIDVSVTDKLKLVDNKYFASLEQIMLWDPAVILVNEQGVDGYIQSKSQWKNIAAVKNSKVFLLPSGLTRWGHPESIEIPLVTLWTAKQLYPALFTDINLKDETKNFYQTFFSLNLSDAEVNQILSGQGMRIPKGGN